MQHRAILRGVSGSSATVAIFRSFAVALAIAHRPAADQALKDETAVYILKDEMTGKDMEVRRAALDALGDRTSTVVVMNPKTGRSIR